jgi:hypothetical protein
LGGTLSGVSLTTQVSGILPVANGGTNASTASITSFNNITGYSASGATGTTSTNLVFSTSPSITTPTLAGDVNLSTGNLVQGTSGKGVNFTANTHATGMTSKLLNDYEEGTWTPNQGSGLVLVGAFSSSGTYTKVGRQVTVNFSISGATTIAITAGGVISTNLPFTGLAGINGAGTIFRFGAAGGQCIIGNSSTVSYNGAAIGAGGELNLTITYFY